MDIDKWNKRVLESQGIKAETRNMKIVRSLGDLKKATLWDGTQVERQESIYVEGHGLVKTAPYELHFVYESPTHIKGWGLYCFPGNTMINVSDMQVPIKDIKAGEWVLTSNGEYNKVIQSMQRQYSGKMIKIKPSNITEIICTEEHPFLVERNGNIEWIEANRIEKTDLLLESVLGNELATSEYLKFEYKTMLANKEFQVELNKDLFRLCGYYLAEGHLSCNLKGRSGYSDNKYKKYSVWFSFNKNEEKYIQDVRNLMLDIFGVKGILTHDKSGNGNGIHLIFTTRKGYEFFEKMLGKYSEKKYIHPILLHHSNENKMELVKSFWFGDGTSSKTGIEFGTTSPHLAYQIRWILSSNKIFPSVNIRKPEHHKPSIVNGNIITQKHDFYRISVYGEAAIKLNLFLDGESLYNRKKYRHGNVIIDNQFMFIKYPISEISSFEVENMDVYNLEIEEDPSFHANGIIVHNCTCGSIAGVVGLNAYSKLASPTSTGKMIVCIRHTTTKQNTGVGRHADGSTE